MVALSFLWIFDQWSHTIDLWYVVFLAHLNLCSVGSLASAQHVNRTGPGFDWSVFKTCIIVFHAECYSTSNGGLSFLLVVVHPGAEPHNRIQILQVSNNFHLDGWVQVMQVSWLSRDTRKSRVDIRIQILQVSLISIISYLLLDTLMSKSHPFLSASSKPNYSDGGWRKIHAFGKKTKFIWYKYQNKRD